jgi:acyl-CoA thioester hydrolase
MGRVKLELPEALPFETEMTVRITDINYGGHLGNDALLGLLQEARIRFLGSRGFAEKDVGGAGIIMVDAVVLYRSEAFYGEALRIQVGTSDPQPLGCDFVYRVFKKKDGKEVARAKTGIAFFDYEKRKVVSMPEQFREVFGDGAA